MGGPGNKTTDDGLRRVWVDADGHRNGRLNGGMIAGTVEESSSSIEGDSPVERLRQRIIEERAAVIDGAESAIEAQGQFCCRW